MAPTESSLARKFSKSAYVTYGDLAPERYSGLPVQRVDLMDMSGLAKFDIFYASHVMEHVPDDRLVMRNVREHLKLGGQAWILVPLHDDATKEHWPGMSAGEREEQFGQWDHVRQYGLDIADRLREAGFDVTLLDPMQVELEERARQGLSSGDKIFVATRR
jgi:SAM-dependent methyltransferase